MTNYERAKRLASTLQTVFAFHDSVTAIERALDEAAAEALKPYRTFCKNNRADVNCDHSLADHDENGCQAGVEVDMGWAKCACDKFHSEALR
jgi:hypothetical protein